MIDEIRTLAENGHKEIVLTGIHVCSYGIDLDDESWAEGRFVSSEHETGSGWIRDYRGETKLFDLVEMIDREIPESLLSRIRLGSLEPRVITEENVRRLVKMKRVCPHFHLSLQSGCDETLKRMNRHYTAEEYKKSVEMLRKAYAKEGVSCAITTDVIVGFPGETEEEFEITRKYLEDLKLYEMHIFKYSRRKGTVADRLPDQIPEDVKSKRSDVLLEMTEKHSRHYRQERLGQPAEVLIEEKKGGYYIGHTADYIRVVIPEHEFDSSKAPENTGLEGSLKEVILDKLTDDDSVIGKVAVNV